MSPSLNAPDCIASFDELETDIARLVRARRGGVVALTNELLAARQRITELEAILADANPKITALHARGADLETERKLLRDVIDELKANGAPPHCFAAMDAVSVYDSKKARSR